MNIRTSMIALIACLVASRGALAAESWHTSTINKVYPQANGTFIVVFDTNAADCLNTNPQKFHYVAPAQSGVTDEGAKMIYAAALLALAMDKTVQVAFDNATSSCLINRMVVLK